MVEKYGRGRGIPMWYGRGQQVNKFEQVYVVQGPVTDR